jgi:hypothetical protein
LRGEKVNNAQKIVLSARRAGKTHAALLAAQERIAELEALLARRDALLDETEKELADWEGMLDTTPCRGISSPPRRPTGAELEMAAYYASHGNHP